MSSTIIPMHSPPMRTQDNASVHTSSLKLEDQAATTALYVTNPGNKKKIRDQASMDESQHKLSAAGAAASLKYAKPKDLPSFPTLGLTDGQSSAGAAASLANSSHTPVTPWKPDPSASASAAAIIANEYRAPKVWQPETNTHSTRAALLAHAGRVSEAITPERSPYSSSTASQSLRSDRRQGHYLGDGHSTEAQRGSLLAATGAFASSRRRSGSAPTAIGTYPDSANAAANALNAANLAHSPSMRTSKLSQPSFDNLTERSSSPIDAERLHNVARRNVARDLHNARPPVSQETTDRNRADILQAAAVSMARQIYAVQQNTINQAAGSKSNHSQQAANRAGARPSSSSSASQDPEQVAMQLNNLEEAARKLAAQRLAKLHDEHAAYRNYYGTGSSLTGRSRQRAASLGQSTSEDEDRSRKIRNEMSLFTNQLAQVDAKKRKRDRAALLAAAQRNVQASMHDIDEKVYAETGRMKPSMKEEWEAKAVATAEADSKARMANYGKIDIGGGKYMGQTEIDAVAVKNVQPLLEEINDKAEKERARQVELKLEQEQKNRKAEEEKLHEKEIKEEQKRAKALEKQNEKAKKAEHRQLHKEERRSPKTFFTKSKEAEAERPEPVIGLSNEKEQSEAPRQASSLTPLTPTTPTTPIAPITTTTTDSNQHNSGRSLTATPHAENDPVQFAGFKESPPSSPKSPGKARVREWLKDKFRRTSKNQRDNPSGEEKEKDVEVEKSFVEGVALANEDSTSEERESSIRQIAMVGREDRGHKRSTEPSLSSFSDAEVIAAGQSAPVSPVSETHGERGRVSSPRNTPPKNEDLEEERDKFDEALAPPPTFATTNRISSSPVRDSKFVENL